MTDSIPTPASDANTTINVFDKFGDPQTIPASSWPQAQSAGFTQPTPEQVAQYAKVQAHAGVGSDLKAFAAGAARSATFGGSDQLMTHAGDLTGDPSLNVNPQTLSDLQKYNPKSTIGGEIAGIAGSMKLPLAPARLLSEGAQGIAHALAPAAETAGTVSGVLGQVAAHTVGSAVEGAAYGLGQSVTEHALGDPDLNGEKLLSNIGYGALWGGALGGALKAGEIGAPMALDQAKSSLGKVSDAIFGHTAPGEIGPMGKAYAQASSFVSGRPYEEIVQALQERKLALTEPSETMKMAEDLHGALDEHVENLNKVLRDANSELRPEETKQLLEGVPSQPAFERYISIQNRIRDTIKTMRETPDLYAPYYAKKLEQINERFGTKIWGDSETHEIFSAMDELKSRLDDEIKYGRDIPPQDREAQNAIKGIRNEIKETLTNDSTFGPAAARQAAFNDAQAGLLRQTGKKGLFRKYFLEPRLSQSGAQIYRVSPTKVQSFLRQLGSMTGDEKARVLQEFLDSSHNVLGEVGKTYDTFGASFKDDLLPGAEKKVSVDDFQKTAKIRDDAVKQVEFNKRLNRLGAGAHNTYLGEQIALGAGIHLHPAVGGAIEGFNMLRNPGLMVQRLAKIEQMMQSTSKLVASGSKSIFKAVDRSANTLKGYTAGAIATTDQTKQHDKTVAQISELSNNPQKLADNLDSATRDLYHVAPNTSGSLQTAAVRATQFLSSKIPGVMDQRPLDRKYTPSQTEIAKFNRYYNTVKNPVGVLNDVRTATVTPEAIETLTNVYPKLFQHMQSEVLSALTDHLAKKKSIAYQTKLSLAQFLNQDLDRSLSQTSIASNQMAQMNMGQEQAKSQPQMKPTNGMAKLTKSTSMLTNAQANSQRKDV